EYTCLRYEGRGGENCGWIIVVGAHCYQRRCDPEGFVLPVAEYHHRAEGACSITGGYVYRGAAHPSLQGVYFFGDYCSGRLYAMPTPEIAGTAGPLPWTRAAESGAAVASCGADHDGERYVPELPGGRILRVVAQYVRPALGGRLS